MTPGDQLGHIEYCPGYESLGADDVGSDFQRRKNPQEKTGNIDQDSFVKAVLSFIFSSFVAVDSTRLIS